MNELVKEQLLQAVAEDGRVREELAATGELFEGYAPRMEEVHNSNARLLETMIYFCGWPGKSLVGEEGSKAEWLIVQHAIGRPDFQRRCLPLLQEASQKGEIEAAAVAFLEDRICFFERRPQKYGTQFDWDENGQMSPWILQDEARVDEFRGSVGLEPLAERTAQIRASLLHETAPDFAQRQAKFDQWLRKVGWTE